MIFKGNQCTEKINKAMLFLRNQETNIEHVCLNIESEGLEK